MCEWDVRLSRTETGPLSHKGDCCIGNDGTVECRGDIRGVGSNESSDNGPSEHNVL